MCYCIKSNKGLPQSTGRLKHCSPEVFLSHCNEARSCCSWILGLFTKTEVRLITPARAFPAQIWERQPRGFNFLPEAGQGSEQRSPHTGQAGRQRPGLHGLKAPARFSLAKLCLCLWRMWLCWCLGWGCVCVSQVKILNLSLPPSQPKKTFYQSV